MTCYIAFHLGKCYDLMTRDASAQIKEQKRP